jgi:hypothetical protein
MTNFAHKCHKCALRKVNDDGCYQPPSHILISLSYPSGEMKFGKWLREFLLKQLQQLVPVLCGKVENVYKIRPQKNKPATDRIQLNATQY